MSDHTGRLASIQARAALATPGPWAIIEGPIASIVRGIESDTTIIIDDDFDCTRDDAKFIAAAREDIPWLLCHLEVALAEVTRLNNILANHKLYEYYQTEIDRLRAALGMICLDDELGVQARHIPHQALKGAK